MKNIVWLTELNKGDISLGGGKGANLGEMYNAKLPVPPAFIVTAHAYSSFLKEAGLNEKIQSILSTIDIQDTAQLDKKAKEIRKLVTDAEMSEELQAEIIEAYTDMNVNEDMISDTKKDIMNILKTTAEPEFVAVRSSATTEDLETASFAGQQETFLNVKGNSELIEKVKRCWASLFTARAIYYREQKGFEHAKSYVAVVVQKMIDSEKAGVAFTVNPITNNPEEIIIEAAYGLGEGVVSGTVAPDHYVVDKKTFNIKDKKIKKQFIYFTRDSSGKTVKKEVPPGKVAKQVLSDSEIKRLAEICVRIEDHYNSGQDIEFGTDQDEIYILQSRHITTIKEQTESKPLEGKVILEGLPASPGIASGVVKIIKNLEDLPRIVKGDILVTKMTNPDMVVTMQKSAAIVTDEGGVTAHAAIVSREMGTPCIVGTMNATSVLKEGQIITIDGRHGKIYEGKIEAAVHQAQAQSGEGTEEKKFMELKEQIKTKTKIYMNLGNPDKIDEYKNLQFDGIGLMRLEFMIASQIGEHPLYLIETNQQEKYINKLVEGIGKVAKAISPKPVIVRFSDFKSNEYRDLKGGEKYEPHESNSMIGFRGVSRYVSEQFKEAFKLECKAIKKLREQENCKNVWVMLPFVRTIKEVNQCLEILKQEGLRRSEDFKILLMAEVPSMALIAEDFAKLQIDGASIGSNDLTQLVLGVDRDSALLGKMGYFDERNPAVLVAIGRIIKSFINHGKTVSICGQAPSVYPEIVDFLIEKGVTSISVNPDVVNSVRLAVSEKEKKELPSEELAEIGLDDIKPLKDDELEDLLGEEATAKEEKQQ